MRIGTGPGPGGSSEYQSTHYVYDIRSGVILETHHFVGKAKPLADREKELVETASRRCGIPSEHLGALSNPEVESGQGVVRVDHKTRRLVRKEIGADLRIAP